MHLPMPMTTTCKPLVFAALLLGGCAGVSTPETKEEAQAEVARLEAEARALAGAGPCQAGDCRTAPVGAKACGGPRTHLVYCATTTDSAALFRKLEQLRLAEQAYNAKWGGPSTCDIVSPPQTELSGGMCVARPR